ncbi:MAG: DUF1071 domain-containing protein, partial [Spirochaetales bacterium]|nr:DUF1071 domain-containing protein [Spirochaetales bacterium]
RHGLGLYIYAGEDLPDSTSPVMKEPVPQNPFMPPPQPQWRQSRSQYFANK